MLLILSSAVLISMTAVMAVAWAVGVRQANAGWTDVFWTFGTGAILAAAALWPIGSAAAPQPRQWLIAGLVAVWALRLGLYIAGRVAGHPEDARYARFRMDWGQSYARKMLWVTLPQAPASALLALSVLVAARRPEALLDLRDLAGAAVLAIALVGESVADAQMQRFRREPGAKGEICQDGLWGWSRHPNYFFEWFGWLAYPVMALVPGQPLTWLSLVAPLVMFVLLTRISGIPPLEQAMLRSRGEAFRAYQASVSPFFPLPPKRV
jgi:steroid 5-alpha reductase family enzyme